MTIFLLGFMGSGKSTLAHQLASLLNLKFIDQDKLIEDKLQMTVGEIFASLGEEKFRKLENEAIRELGNEADLVVATGGGAPCFYDNMNLMNELGITIYLKVPPETLAHRLKHSHGTRPLIAGKSEQEIIHYIHSKLLEREPFYKKARITIEAADLKATDILRVLRDMKLL